jgi:hypothetical protein
MFHSKEKLESTVPEKGLRDARDKPAPQSSHVFKAPLPNRNYRQPRIETPSNVGGLSQAAKDRAVDRKSERDRFKGWHTTKRLKETRSEWDQTPKSDTGGSTPRIVPRTGSVRRVGGVRSSSDWDLTTPRVSTTGYNDQFETPAGVDDDWRNEQQQLDRDWYNLEESGVFCFKIGRK